jgi:hypothetical protein
MTSTEYYRKNPRARKKKQAYDSENNKRPSEVKKRVESNQKRREARRRGQNIKGKDYDHAVNRFVPTETNRGRAGEGGRKKGSTHQRSL